MLSSANLFHALRFIYILIEETRIYEYTNILVHDTVFAIIIRERTARKEIKVSLYMITILLHNLKTTLRAYERSYKRFLIL